MLWLAAPVSLILAAMTSARIPLILLSAIGVGAPAAAVPLYFFRAWRRVGSVPNRREYIVWVGIETLIALGLIAGFVSMFLQ
jgi:hypothetical protein